MKLPCGCDMWREGDTFYIIPCSSTCENYQYALEKSKKKGNKIMYKKHR
jgi:hypothetical protein